MKKRILGITALTLLLAACSDEETTGKEKDQTEETKQEEVVEDEEFSLEVTDEEWLALSNQSKWWEENDLTEPEFGQAVIVQFDEDTIPEVVIPYTQAKEEPQGLLIGKYNETDEKWAIFQNVPIDNSLKIEILEDKLTFSNGTEVLVTQESDDTNKTLATYKYSKEDDEVVATRIDVDVDQPIEVDPAENTISYFVDGEEKKETVEEE
ncbi:MAG: hypothetical protein ABS934_02740 [Psychrobacillus sp.]